MKSMGIRNVISHSAWICWKDLLEFSRSKLRLIMLVLMPLFMMVMVGFIFPSGSSISDTPIALVNNDAGSLGSSFVASLETINNKTGMMDLRSAQDYDDVKTQLQNSEISGGIIIPENFSADIRAGKQGLITIVIDQSNPQLSVAIQSVLTKTIEAMGKQMAISNLNTHYNVSITTATASGWTVSDRIEPITGPNSGSATTQRAIWPEAAPSSQPGIGSRPIRRSSKRNSSSPASTRIRVPACTLR